jgi:hypothetical protein
MFSIIFFGSQCLKHQRSKPTSACMKPSEYFCPPEDQIDVITKHHISDIDKINEFNMENSLMDLFVLLIVFS